MKKYKNINHYLKHKVSELRFKNGLKELLKHDIPEVIKTKRKSKRR